MNERKIIDRKFLANLAKEVGLNALHLEALGECRQWEIVVGGDMPEWLVEIQHRFERLAVMGDDEYRGFYIEIPRPEPEERGDAEELIASGEYDSQKVFLVDWLAFNPKEFYFARIKVSSTDIFRCIGNRLGLPIPFSINHTRKHRKKTPQELCSIVFIIILLICQ
ncbi:hypothetical protein [uncultured Bacteroides sp.]|uniref:hypothetical protein n=1 Tax=uncultured Bacteroides sp. TaxID=162156 RepID=UPI0025989755|nr:hypothetical protein [uncultured Bacteroides sp.]